MNHEIEITCPNCGHKYDAHLHWLVCPKCGHETKEARTVSIPMTGTVTINL